MCTQQTQCMSTSYTYIYIYISIYACVCNLWLDVKLINYGFKFHPYTISQPLSPGACSMDILHATKLLSMVGRAHLYVAAKWSMVLPSQTPRMAVQKTLRSQVQLRHLSFWRVMWLMCGSHTFLGPSYVFFVVSTPNGSGHGWGTASGWEHREVHFN